MCVVLVRRYFYGELLGVVRVFEGWGDLVTIVEVDDFECEGRLCGLSGCMWLVGCV